MSIYIGCGSEKGDVFAIEFNCLTNKFVDTFIDVEAQMSPVTTMLSDGDLLISGGNNGSLQTYSFEMKQKLFAFDNFHESSITSISLSSDKNFLFTTGDNGLIAVWKRFGMLWENIRIIDKHKKSVMLAVHPSDKFAMSISKDNTFRVWDLYNGRQSHKMQIRTPYVNIKISPSGKYYMLSTFNLVNVYDFEEAKLKFSIKTSGNIKEIVFIDDVTICIAELKKITFYELTETMKAIFSKDLDNYNCKIMSFTKGLQKEYMICSVVYNSKAAIQVYDVTNVKDDKKLSLLGSYDICNLRITAVTCVYK